MKKLFLMFAVAGFVISTSSASFAGDDKDKKEAKKECSKDAKSCCKKDGAKACAKADASKSCHSGEKADKKTSQTPSDQK